MQNHIVLTHRGAVTNTLLLKLQNFKIRYVLIEPDLTKALDLLDHGVKVVLGKLDDPETYKNVSVENAALVATTSSDAVNTIVTYAVRSVSEKVPIISTAQSSGASNILKIAGCNQVFALDGNACKFIGKKGNWR